MKVLSRSVSSFFEAFYGDIERRIGVPIQFERGPLGAIGDYRLENGVAKIRLKTDMSRPAFEHNAAHELVHALQAAELWPKAAKRSGLEDDSMEAQVGVELQSLVLDLNVEDRLRVIGFDTTYANDVRYKNTKRGLRTKNVPLIGSHWWCIWTLRYAHLSLTQARRKWEELKDLYLARAPYIVEKGEELVSILRKHGWGNPDEALASMIAIRDSLGLAAHPGCIIEDPRTGEKF